MADSNKWKDWYSKKKGTIDEDISKLEKLLRQNDFSRILDFGCGAGRHLVYFARKGFQVYGFDQSSDAIEQVKRDLQKERLNADVKVLNMSEKLPYEDGFFDAVISTRVLHHSYTKTIKRIIREITRVTRSNGYVYIQVPTLEKALRLKSEGETFNEPEPGTRIPLDGPEKGIPHHNFSEEELISLFKDYYDIEDIHVRNEHYCLLAKKR